MKIVIIIWIILIFNFCQTCNKFHWRSFWRLIGDGMEIRFQRSYGRRARRFWAHRRHPRGDSQLYLWELSDFSLLVRVWRRKSYIKVFRFRWSEKVCIYLFRLRFRSSVITFVSFFAWWCPVNSYEFFCDVDLLIVENGTFYLSGIFIAFDQMGLCPFWATRLDFTNIGSYTNWLGLVNSRYHKDILYKPRYFLLAQRSYIVLQSLISFLFPTFVNGPFVAST